jgi:hypothetical protein
MHVSQLSRFNRLLTALTTMTLLPLAIACSNDDASTGLSSGPGQIDGTVTSEKTAHGIPNLVVALVHDGEVVAATPTDSGGAFSFRGLAQGDYVVRLTGIELSHLDPLYNAFTPDADSVTVGDVPVRLFFAAVGLIPPRVVGVVSCDGAPVSSAQVRVIGASTDTVVSTTAQGRYGATELDPGHYAVIVVDAPCPVEPSYGAVELLPGQAAEVNFTG